jgi:hypothetical protein
MLEHTPDNQRNAQQDTLALSNLGYASNQTEVFQALTINSIESAGLPELEKALELALEWPKTNKAFSKISQALLEDQDSAALGFKSRLCAAYAQTLEHMSSVDFDSQTALKLLRLLKSTELAIDTLTLTSELRYVTDFERLPYAMLNLTASLFDPHCQKLHLPLKRRVVELLSQVIIPALDQAEVLDWSFRRELSQVVRIILAQENISVAILKDDTESVNYLLNVFDLAHAAQSSALQPMMIDLTEYLLDCYTSAASRLEQKCGELTLEVLLASAISALSMTGDCPRSRPLLRQIYEEADVLSAPWNEAFLALSRIDLLLTYEQLPMLVAGVLENKVIEADLTLLKYLRIPGGTRAVSVELKRAVDHSLVKELGMRYVSYFDSSVEGAVASHALDRESLAEIFKGYGLEF